MQYVELDSLIPLSDPDKRKIESSLSLAFSDLPGGPWRITLFGPSQGYANVRASWSVHVVGETSVTAGGIHSSEDVGGFMKRAGFASPALPGVTPG